MESGTQILNIVSESVHVVDVCENYGETSVVFTKDSKCFNIKDVRTMTDREIISFKLRVDTIPLEDWEY